MSQEPVALMDALASVIQTRTSLNVDGQEALLLGKVKHAFTHFKNTRHVYLMHLPSGQASAMASALRRAPAVQDTSQDRMAQSPPGPGPAVQPQRTGSHATRAPSERYDDLRWVKLTHVRQLALTRSDQKILELYEKHRLSLFAQTR